MKIVIISSGQPSANPRAVKEAILLSQNNFEVTFIYCLLSPWADAFDKKLFADNASIKWIAAGYHPINNKPGFWFARLRKKCWQLISKYAQNKFGSNIKSSVLFSQELLKEALKHKADLYIGHNLGAIAAVVKAAKKYKAKAGFDAEDFHRGEFRDVDIQKKITASIENKYFPLMDYCTVASPLIGEAYKRIFPDQIFTEINNVFSKKYLKKGKSITEKKSMDLFWFSQFIGPKRDLETVLLALNECKDLDIKLHLLGNINESYKTFMLETVNDKTKILFLSPTSSEEIFTIGSQFDIGLATELPETLNREFCLTNKIFTYLLSGNAILFSDTKAQSKFLHNYSGIGLLYQSENVFELVSVFKKLYYDRSLLNTLKENALALAQNELNWENEGETFIKLVKSTLSNN